ncbi:MAG: PocR ligand-binding domain-containing protein [Clostridia bacterium]|nr:PocR ligand-binding domain-containing protein [Clostridia bacterium]
MKNEYNVQKLQTLFRDFYCVTGLRVGLFDAAGRPILEYPIGCSKLCSLVRATEEGRHRCLECDAYGIKQAGERGQAFDYRCHAGLIDVCAPMRDEDGIVGYVIFGQSLDNMNRERQWEVVKKNCADLVADTDALRSAFDELKGVDAEYIGAVIHILDACIGYIRLDRMMKSSKSGLWRTILSYIGRNLSSKISLATVAEELGVSVSTICRCVKSNADCTLGELIWHERIELAKQMLSTTDLSVMEVASRVGVDDYNYFIRMFRRYCGKSPAAWRRDEKKNRLSVN